MASDARRRGIGMGVATLWLAGCTLISGVNDYTVVDDGGVAQDESFDLLLHDMIPHASQTVDCAVFDDKDRLTARAVVRMPPAPASGSYPDVRIHMQDALPAGHSYSAAFYADLNGNGQLDPPPMDHSWIVPLASDGSAEFTHNTMFDDLTKLDLQPIGADVVVSFEERPVDVGNLISQQSHVFELRLTLVAAKREVGLLQLHPDPNTPLPNEFRLSGIVDAGNIYRMQVFRDGKPVQGSEKRLTAPSNGDLEIKVGPSLFGLGSP